MKTSIIINTFNRAEQLDDCLSSLNHVRHDDFEVIVVNGPSTDSTEVVCHKYRDRIKYVECSEQNLSMSRNIGIANAAGDIVAFIDDDAVVHPAWLSRIVEGYRDPKVVGVGGYTIDHTGRKYQAGTTLCDRLGHAYSVPNISSDGAFCHTGSMLFLSLLERTRHSVNQR